MSDFLDAVLKNPDGLTETDKQVINDNAKDLNEEEVVKFKDFLTPATTEAPTTEAPVTTASTTPPAAMLPTDKLDSYLEQKRKEWAAQGATQTQVNEAAKKTREYFKEGELPKDWNDALGRFHSTLSTDLEEQKKAWKAELKEELKKERETEEQERKVQKLNSKLDEQYKDLHKEGKVPDPKTPEGQTFDRMLATVAAQYKLDNYKQAYEKFLEINAGATAAVAPKVNPNKAAAAMVGSGTTRATASKSNTTYQQIHKARSISALATEGF